MSIEVIFEIVCIIGITGIMYLSYVLGANDFSTSWLDDREKIIDDMLKHYGYRMYTYAGYDCAPCEVEYGLCRLNSKPDYVMPSRIMKKYIKRIKDYPDEIVSVLAIQETYRFIGKKELSL